MLIERISCHHTGHLPNSAIDKRTRPVCPELEQKIIYWIQLGVKTDVILINAHKWAHSNGHYDIEDSAFIVTPSDIQNIRKKHLRTVHFDENDSLSVHKMATETYHEDVVLYQQYEFGENPLILVLQTKEMKEDLSKSTSKMIFMDATNSVNKYGFPLWSLLVANEFGRGVPVAHIIASQESTAVLAKALTALKHNCGFKPRFVYMKWFYLRGCICTFAIYQRIH